MKHLCPLEDELCEPRKFNGKKFYWCCPETGGKCNGAWRGHKPSKCQTKDWKDKGKFKGKFKGKENKEKKKELEKKKVVLQQALDELEGAYESDE